MPWCPIHNNTFDACPFCDDEEAPPTPPAPLEPPPPAEPLAPLEPGASLLASGFHDGD